MDFYKLLKEKELVFLDGAMGTMLFEAGLKTGELPEVFGVLNPDKVTAIHRSYVEAGSDIIYTNTFGANRHKVAGSGYSVSELIKQGIRNARAAVEGTDALVALDIGPVGRLTEPLGNMSFDEAYDIYKEIIVSAISGDENVDLVVLETMTDLKELKAAVLAVKENSDLPVMCSMSFEKNGRTFLGTGVSAMALTLEGLGVDAIGINCSLGPDELVDTVSELLKFTTLPILLKPNAGLPDPVTGEFKLTAADFASKMLRYCSMGIKLMGGCCGTSPEFIRELRHKTNTFIKENKDSYERGFELRIKQQPSAFCTNISTVIANGPLIVGERINPTGKKLFKEALRNGDMDYILGQASEQIEAGADLLDVNVGLPEINEIEMMKRTVEELQAVTDIPLQLDSTSPEVLETALRIYNGKPIVNSVNGEEKSLDTILPLVKKYGAAVVGLTMDENGIPKTVEQRLEIAKRIRDRAEAIGISRNDIYIDCLTLTASAEQEQGFMTLDALERVKKELGCKTVLGVSNISFGLPYRELVNQTFLAIALAKGLDLAIINPNVEGMSGTIRAYKVLAGIDENACEYVEKYKDYKAVKVVASAAAPMTSGTAMPGTSPASATVLNSGMSADSKQTALFDAVVKGMKNEAATLTEELLKEMDSMKLVDDILVPALDKIGQDYEKGSIFLPQLILASNASQGAFEVIKNRMRSQGTEQDSKGVIVIATVKGDVHDIGKNIVAVLLENYGYKVVDLGKDVEPSRIVEAAIEHKAGMVGLSALMTTTVKAMDDTIKLLREKNVPCKVMVGGAVLTPEYADSIGADFYCKDAKAAVDAAKKVF